MRLFSPAGFVAVACIALQAAPASAQDRRGIVRDSTTREPVAGVVLLMLDSAGQTIGRNLTDAAGRYRIALTPAIRRLRLVRIGYRPIQVDAPADSTDRTILMAAIPTMLEQVRVRSGAQCSPRPDRLAALSLLEQARAGMLATLVARESKPAEMVRLHTLAILDEADDRVRALRLSIDSSSDTRVSFEAAHSAEEFLRDGFLSGDRDGAVFHAPDVETLIDDVFRDGYCFHLRDAEPARPNQIGLGFTAARAKRGRIDIDGTLWIDTVARALREIRFSYVNLPINAASVRPGGTIRFHELANGVVIIDRWTLRIPHRLENARAGLVASRQRFGVQESGGSIVSARWPDGFVWDAPMSSLRVRLVDDAGHPTPGRGVELAQTPFSAIADSAGIASFSRLVAGPYRINARDPSLAPIGVALAANGESVVREHDSVTVELRMPTVRSYIEHRCAADSVPVQTNALLVIGRIMRAPDRVAAGAQWTLQTGAPDGGWTALGKGVVDSDGIFVHCTGGLDRGASVEVRARESSKAPWTEVQTRIAAPITVWPVWLGAGTAPPNLR